MSVQRSHFRRYLSIIPITLLMLTLAAPGYATWAVERGNLRWEMLLNVTILVNVAGFSLFFGRDFHALTNLVLFVLPLLLIATVPCGLEVVVIPVSSLATRVPINMMQD